MLKTSTAGPDVPGLQAFVATARFGGVGRAAVHLGLTQPSVSARLASLEKAWRTRLFRRRSRGMELTPEGRRLLPLAEHALQTLAELDRRASGADRKADELRVGAGDALGRHRVPSALRDLSRRWPGTQLRLLEGPRPRLLQALRNGSIDLALVAGAEDTAQSDLDWLPLFEAGTCVLWPRGEAPRRARVDLRALRDRRLISLQPDSAFRRHLEAAFRRAGHGFEPAVEVGNLSLVRRFVAAGLGVAPVPAVAFEGREAVPGVTKTRLAGVPPLRYLRVIRRGVPPGPVAERFLARLAARRPR